MAALTNTQISVTYVGLLKTSASTVLSSTAQQITDGSGNNSILYLSTAGVGIGGAAASGKELDVTGNVLVTGDLQVDNININGNTISATSGVVTLADGAIATTQSDGDNSTKVATTAYVDTAIGGHDTLAEILAGGNTTGGTDIAVSANDDITFTSTSKAIFGPSTDLQVYSDGSNNYVDSTSNELRIRSNDLRLLNYGTAKYITADSGADVSLYHNDSKKFETTSSGVTITGVAVADGLDMGDNEKIRLGDGQDLEIYHDGTNSIIDNNTNDLIIRCDSDDIKILSEDDIVLRDNDDSTNFIHCVNGGAVKLYHNGSQKLETTSTGASVTGGINVTDTSKIEKAQVTTQFDTSSFLRLHPSATTNSGGFTNMIFGTDTANNFGVAIGGKRAGTDGTPSFVVRMLNDDVTGTEVLNILDTSTTTFTTSTFNISKGSGAVKLEFVQTNGNWKIEAGNSGNNTLIIGSVSNATNNITLDTTNGGSTTFSGDVTINRASNPTKLQIGSSLADDPFIVFQTDGNTMSMGIDRSDSNKFVISDNATLGTNNRFTIDTSGNTTFSGGVNISHSSGDTLTLTKSTTEPSLRIEGDTDKDFVMTVSGELLTFTQNDGATDILTLDHDTKNATFAGVVTVGAGTVAAANAAADDFVIKGPGTTATGMTISNTSDSGTGTIFFGDTTSSSAAGFRYNHNTGDMAISAEDNVTFDCDNVGIGTTSPDAKLEISDATNDNLRIGTRGGNINIFSVNDAGATAPLRLEASDFQFINGNATFAGTVDITGAGNTLHLNASSGVTYQKFSENGTGRFFLATLNGSDGLAFVDADGSTERMRIDSSGNVLVGKTSSTGVATGNIEVSNSSSASVQIEGGTHEWSMLVSSSADALRFYQDSTEHMRIDSSGNLGLGTTTPTSYNSNADNLVINESGDFSGITLAADNDQGSNIYFADPDDDNVGGITYNHTDNYMNFRVNGAERMRIDSSGSVSIGTTSTQAKLEVNKGADGSTSAPQFLIQGGASTYGAFHFLDSDAYHIQTNSAARDIEIICNTGGVNLGPGDTAFSSNSDENLKENIKPLNNVIDKIKNYRCVEYNFKDDKNKNKKIGFIAQDWQKDFSQVVNKNKEDVLSIKYTETIPVLLKAIQEQQDMIQELKKEIEILKSK